MDCRKFSTTLPPEYWMAQGDVIIKYLLYPHREYKLQIADWHDQPYRSANVICACLIMDLFETFYLQRLLEPSPTPNKT